LREFRKQRHDWLFLPRLVRPDWKPDSTLQNCGDFFAVRDGKISDAAFNLLFRFIQSAERQVVLFDAIEDASFAETHDLDGKGSVKQLLTRLSEDGLRQRLLEKLKCAYYPSHSLLSGKGIGHPS
jgi:hypothetical protein